MPIYEFVCKPCGERFEVLTTPSRISEARCPKCASEDVKRVFSTFSSPRSSSASSSGSSGCAGCSSGSCASCGH